MTTDSLYRSMVTAGRIPMPPNGFASTIAVTAQSSLLTRRTDSTCSRHRRYVNCDERSRRWTPMARYAPSY